MMPSTIALRTVPLQSAGGALFFLLVVGLIALALMFFTYTDAQTNSAHPAFLWALVVFLAGLFGTRPLLAAGARQGDRAARSAPAGTVGRRVTETTAGVTVSADSLTVKNVLS